jgi:hypothetical protein
MAWIKRNLIFVIAVAIGIILTGFCGYLLYNSLNANSGTNDDYQANVANLQAAQQKTPYPSKQNIEAATADQARIQKFLNDFRKSFSPFPQPPVEDDRGFKVYLEDSLVRFRAEATNAEVGLAPEYGFSFSSLVNKLNYTPSDISAWMNQLQEISAILDILYKAKINFLTALCRVPVSPDDTGAGDCLIQASTITNQTGVVTPYKITFRGFSTELAAVLEGFAKATNCFIVKSVDIAEDATASQSMPQPQVINQPAAPAFVPAPRGNPLFDHGGRGGLPGYRPTAPPPIYAQRPGAQAAASAGSESPTVFLSENPLIVTIAVDVIKLKTSEK